jgi:hypothetical protein
VVNTAEVSAGVTTMRSRYSMVAVAIMGLLLAPWPARAHNCSCSVTSCKASCDETDFRAALAALDGCTDGTARTLGIDFGCSNGCSLVASMNFSVASCGNDDANGYNAFCVTRDNARRHRAERHGRPDVRLPGCRVDAEQLPVRLRVVLAEL